MTDSMTGTSAAPPHEDLVHVAERLERRLDDLESMTRQLPDLISTLTDVADSWAMRANERGVDLDRRGEVAAELLEKLTRPERLERLERALDVMDSLEPMLVTGVDIIDSVNTGLADRGVVLDERVRSLLALSERLSDPARVAKLDALIDLADQLEPTLTTGVDILDGLTARLAERGVLLDERVRAVSNITEKLTEPARLAKLEQLIDLADQLEPTLTTGVDIFDSLHVKLADRGVVIDERARALAELGLELTEPARIEQLRRLLDLADQAEPMVATVTDIADNLIEKMQERGIDLHDRGARMLSLVELATRPRHITAFQTMLDNPALLEKAAELVAETPNLIAIGADVFDGWMAQALESGFDAGAFGQNLGDATSRLFRLLQDEAFEKLMVSGMLDAKTLDVVGRAARALADTHQTCDHAEVGPWGMMKSTKDRRIRRALGFAVRFGKRFGELLSPQLAE